jgi:ABC-2 type transport system permease protein
MFLNILAYEFKLLSRSNWLLILLFTLVLLISFASINGGKNIAKRITDISKMEQEFYEKDSLMKTTLIKIENKQAVDLPYWQLPSEPMTIGNRYPRLAVMYPESLSFIATGQSDMYTHFISPKVYGNNFALDYSEMVNPVQLLFGNFDIAFVLIYIIPLIIIAFTYNVLSKEKELGTLRLLASQPLSTKSWLLQKMIIRFIIFTTLTSSILSVVIAVFSIKSLTTFSGAVALLSLTIFYNLFWFIIAYVVNVKINDSSKNAITLIGFWLLLALVIPATINQVGSALYPTPSRLKLINEIRLIKKENEEQQNEIMDAYMRNHPELAEGSNKDQFGFWHNYFASEKVMEEKTKPILTAYETQLKKQQKLILNFQFLSPSILMQQSLNKIAGSSELHYNDYKRQVYEFSKKWRNFLTPMLFKKQKFTMDNYNELPSFTYINRIENNIWTNILAVFIINVSILVYFGGWRRNYKGGNKYLK